MRYFIFARLLLVLKSQITDVARGVIPYFRHSQVDVGTKVTQGHQRISLRVVLNRHALDRGFVGYKNLILGELSEAD